MGMPIAFELAAANLPEREVDAQMPERRLAASPIATMRRLASATSAGFGS